MARTSLGLGLAALAVLGCGEVVGLDDLPCEPGCTPDGERISCEGGVAKTEPCSQVDRCHAGQCVPAHHLSALNCTTCATRRDGKVWCWGANDLDPFGAKKLQNFGMPVPIDFPAPVMVADVSVGTTHVCVVTDEGDVYCWGANYAGQAHAGQSCGVDPACSTDEPVHNHLPAKIKKVSAGVLHTCALSVDGDVYCWGSNHAGQCGQPPAPGYSAATNPTTHKCAFDAGQLLLNKSTLILEPTLVDFGGAKASDIVVQKNTSCAVVAGKVLCWGSNCGSGGDDDFERALGVDCSNGGQLGENPKDLCFRAEPMEPGLGTELLSATSLGHVSGFAILGPNSELHAWGWNGGQLGRGPVVDDKFGLPAPVLVNESTSLIQVDAVARTNGWHGFARIKDTSIYGSRYVSWGRNDCGELGRGAPATPGEWSSFAEPATVIKDEGAHSLVSGQDHACYMDGSDEVHCFGAKVWLGQGGNSATCGDEKYCPTIEPEPQHVNLPP